MLVMVGNMNASIIDFKLDIIQKTIDIMIDHNPTWSYWDFLKFINTLIDNPKNIPPVYAPFVFTKENYYLLMDQIRISLSN